MWRFGRGNLAGEVLVGGLMFGGFWRGDFGRGDFVRGFFDGEVLARGGGVVQDDFCAGGFVHVVLSGWFCPGSFVRFFYRGVLSTGRFCHPGSFVQGGIDRGVLSRGFCSRIRYTYI